MSCCGLLYIPKLMLLRKGGIGATGGSPHGTVMGTELVKSQGDDPLSNAVVGTATLQHGRNASLVRSGNVVGGRQMALSPANSMSGDGHKSSAGSANGAGMASGGGGAGGVGGTTAFSPSGPRAGLSRYASQASSIIVPARSPSPMSPAAGAASVREVGPLFAAGGSRRGSSGLTAPVHAHAPDAAVHFVHVKQSLYEQQQPGAVNTDSNDHEGPSQSPPPVTDSLHVDIAQGHE